MPIEFRCIRCGQRLRVGNESAGMRARCPSCEAVLDVPTHHDPAPATLLSATRSDVIDYELFGDGSQYVEITLDPGEVVGARISNLLYMASGIAIETAALGESTSDHGFLELLSQWSGRVRSSNDVAMTAFCNVANYREKVAFAPTTPGQLAPLHMDELDRQIYCQSSAILCIARGIDFVDAEIPGFENGLLCVSGDGVVVLQGTGQLLRRAVSEHQQIQVRTDCVIAITKGIRVSPLDGVADQSVGVSTIRGPGEIWLQSMASAS